MRSRCKRIGFSKCASVWGGMQHGYRQRLSIATGPIAQHRETRPKSTPFCRIIPASGRIDSSTAYAAATLSRQHSLATPPLTYYVASIYKIKCDNLIGHTLSEMGRFSMLKALCNWAYPDLKSLRDFLLQKLCCQVSNHQWDCKY